MNGPIQDCVGQLPTYPLANDVSPASIFTHPYQPDPTVHGTAQATYFPYTPGAPVSPDIVPIPMPSTPIFPSPCQPGPPWVYTDEYKRGWFDGYHAAKRGE